MADATLIQANEAAKKEVYQHLESAWDSVDRQTNRIRALCKSITALLPSDAVEDRGCREAAKEVAKEMALLIDDAANYLWCDIDGTFGNLRDELGIKRAEYEQGDTKEARHG